MAGLPLRSPGPRSGLEGGSILPPARACLGLSGELDAPGCITWELPERRPIAASMPSTLPAPL